MIRMNYIWDGEILLTNTAMIVDAETLAGSSFSSASMCSATGSLFSAVVIVGGMVIRSPLSIAILLGIELAEGLNVIHRLYIQAGWVVLFYMYALALEGLFLIGFTAFSAAMGHRIVSAEICSQKLSPGYSPRFSESTAIHSIIRLISVDAVGNLRRLIFAIHRRTFYSV